MHKRRILKDCNQKPSAGGYECANSRTSGAQSVAGDFSVCHYITAVVRWHVTFWKDIERSRKAITGFRRRDSGSAPTILLEIETQKYCEGCLWTDGWRRIIMAPGPLIVIDSWPRETYMSKWKIASLQTWFMS